MILIATLAGFLWGSKPRASGDDPLAEFERELTTE